MGEIFTLPFAGENEVFSIYGNRDCNGDGKWDTAKHGGWDVRPPKVGGVVPTKQGQAVCSGRVDWKNVYNAVTRDNGTNSYGNAVRIVTEGGVRAYMAHLYSHNLSVGEFVNAGDIVGQYGPRTTGNSGGVHCHVEFRLGGTSTTRRTCPGNMFGMANSKDVTYHRERMEAATIGWLDCTRDNYRWRLGPGVENALFEDANNKALQYCIKGVLYRVYAVAHDKDGAAWYQITPGDACITKGTAPVCWVSGECGTYTAKQPASPADSLKEAADGLHVMKFTPTSEDDAEALARAMLALRLPVYAAVSAGDAANLKLVADSHKMTVEEV